MNIRKNRWTTCIVKCNTNFLAGKMCGEMVHPGHRTRNMEIGLKESANTYIYRFSGQTESCDCKAVNNTLEEVWD